VSNPRFLLAVDVGNSRIKLGLFGRDEASLDAAALPRCRASLAVPVTGHIPWKEILGWLGPGESQRVTGVVAGANPAGVDQVLQTWPRDEWPLPAVLDDPARFPLEVRVDEPRKVGIDRLLNAVAVKWLLRHERPAYQAIIVDTGTATTVDVVSADGAFLGGAILPGFELSARALHRYTALLPLISVEELAERVPVPCGRNTRQALHSGLFWGQLGAVKELIARLSNDFNTPLPLGEGQGVRAAGEPCLYLTGGGAPLLAPHLPQAQWEPHLALTGLALAVEFAGTK
jgi:type III pantothenate kinase